MKPKITLFILLFSKLSVANELLAQTIEGNWYTPLRNKLLHITISKDSIIFRKCSFDSTMTDYGYIDKAFKVEKVINTYYIVSGIKDTIPSFYLLKFKLEGDKNNMNIESLDSKFFTLSDAENSIKVTSQQPLNIILFNKLSIDKIRQRKDISTMTVSDFKNYASRVIERDSINTNYIKKKYKLSYVYAESTARIILSEIGFNSLVKGDIFDTMIEKFAENPKTKDLIIKMSRSGK